MRSVQTMFSSLQEDGSGRDIAPFLENFVTLVAKWRIFVLSWVLNFKFFLYDQNSKNTFRIHGLS